MKKLFFFIILQASNICLSQSIDEFDYQSFSKPDKKNELSIYFKKNVPKHLLKNIRYYKENSNIIMNFQINNENQPYNIRFTNYLSGELANKIKDLFIEYPIEKLNIRKNKKNNYWLQIIKKKNAKNSFFECSSIIIQETPYNCNSCLDLEYYADINSCIKNKVKEFFFENFDFSKINETKEAFDISFFIDRNGKLKLEKSKKKNKYHEDIVKTFSLLPAFKLSGSFNNQYYKKIFHLRFVYDCKNPKSKLKYGDFDEYSKPTKDNDFAKEIKKIITEQDLKNAGLSRINKNLIISFGFNINEEITNIISNSRSHSLEKKIKSFIKEHSLNTLEFETKDAFKIFDLQILEFENDKAVVKTSTRVSYSSPPIFAACKNVNSNSEAKKCFSKQVQLHFSRKFDLSLANRLGLMKGKKRIYINFIINKMGKIADVEVKAPHSEIKKEVVRVMRLLPESKPGTQRGKAVNFKFAIPFTILVK